MKWLIVIQSLFGAIGAATMLCPAIQQSYQGLKQAPALVLSMQVTVKVAIHGARSGFTAVTPFEIVDDMGYDHI